MAGEPGGLSDFEGDAQREWDGLVDDLLARHDSPHLLAAADDRTPSVIQVDWGGFPVRISRCLQSTADALRLLDWRTPQGDVGRALLQEEYVEWRVVRSPEGRLRRVEMTTELPDYWLTLAAHHPLKALELVRRFAGERSVSPRAVFGGVDPFARRTTPDQRRVGFEDAMLPRGGRAPWSPYNNGERAICFMSQGANTLGALIGLVAAAAHPFAAEGDGRPLSGPEAIATGTQAAQACRNSDPTAVGATIGLAHQGRLIALDDPIGIYIRGVQADRLLQPDGEPVPADWFQLQRGSRPHAGQGLERSQRLAFEVPPGLGFDVADLVDGDTGQPVEHGGQVADLVQLAVYLRISPPGQVPVEPRLLPLPRVTPCEQDESCERDVRRPWRRYQAAHENLLAATPEGTRDRTGAPQG
jgi:hypothetical protein